jgi:hypothetical protein
LKIVLAYIDLDFMIMYILQLQDATTISWGGPRIKISKSPLKMLRQMPQFCPIHPDPIEGPFLQTSTLLFPDTLLR